MVIIYNYTNDVRTYESKVQVKSNHILVSFLKSVCSNKYCNKVKRQIPFQLKSIFFQFCIYNWIKMKIIYSLLKLNTKSTTDTTNTPIDDVLKYVEESSYAFRKITVLEMNV